jgi:autotransporter-associated beta strand protein
VVFDRTDSITVGNITRTTVDNSASLVINSGSVTLGGTGDNSGTGATINAGATLILGKTSSSAAHALSSTTNILVQPGGLLQLAGSGNDQIYMSSVMTDNGIFDLAGHNEGFDQLYGAGVVSNSTGSTSTLQLGENNGTSTFTGAIINGSGSVAFTKIGTGTVTLAGASMYTGDTTVSAGEVVASTASTGAGNYTTANAATLGVSVAGANSSLAAGTVTLGASAASTLEFRSLNSTTAAALNASTLIVNGAVSINIASGAFAAGQTYPLLAYGSIGGSGSFVLKNLPAGVSGTLNTGASPVSLTVTSVVSKTPPTLAASFNLASGTIAFQWPADHTGYLLQSNSVSLLNTNAWQPVAGSTNSNSITVPINTNLPQVFYRLKY